MLLILRDMAFLKLNRFGQILRNNPGLTPRVLSRRLDEMEREGLVLRTTTNEKISYRLTERGEDAVFILLAFLRYGIRHHAAADGTTPNASESHGRTTSNRRTHA